MATDYEGDQALEDLLSVPVGKLTRNVEGDFDWACSGCRIGAHGGVVFEDTEGWLWCESCATSDAIRAAMARAIA